MREYLNDLDFLMKLDKLNLRTQYAKITLLSFDEKPIREIQGNITTGSIAVNGSSPVRRTVNLTMLADEFNSNIENLENEIAINKKIRLEVGYKNPFREYQHYGDIIWFPQGLYVLSTATVARNTSGYNISISGKDKMCMLDGTVGGVFPASVTFHESYIYQDNGDIQVVYPTIFQIIYEAVNHWGGEALENIVISDIDEICRLLVRYMGDKPVYFNDDYSGMSFTYSEDFPHMVSYGDDAGYKETSFTYPGELVFKAGDNVAGLLKKIADLLGNFEYFYDLDGRFIFQQIKNYLNTGSPLNELQPEDYVKSYNNAKFLYSLTDLDTTTAVNRNPKYDNLKNDFYVWGNRQTAAGGNIPIRYHLAIDEKPNIDLAGKYMWELKDEESNLVVRYEFTEIDEFTDDNYKATLIGPPCDEWREELYRRALITQTENSDTHERFYNMELLAEWRNLYDPNNGGWNPDVNENPSRLNYWLDFIDVGSEMGKYSVNQIGRRTKVVNSNELKSIYNKEVPDIIFIENIDEELIEKYDSTGQKYFVLTDKYYDVFMASVTGASCFDKIRELLYQNLNYNTTITLTCLPKYYMEPNNIVYIEDKKSNISGNYQITQFTLPLTYNGTMSITATEVLTRV